MTRRITAVGLVCVFLAGCASEPVPPPLYPLTVTLTQNGKPITQGGLIFIPESGDWGGMVVNASVRRDGTFTAETSRTTPKATIVQPGAPAGRYKVAYHPPGNGEKVGLEYHFPDAVVIEARDNALSLTLPEQLPGAKAEPRDDPKGGAKTDE